MASQGDKAVTNKVLDSSRANHVLSFTTTTIKPLSHIWNINPISYFLTHVQEDYRDYSIKSSEFTDGKSTRYKWYLEAKFNCLTLDLILHSAKRGDYSSLWNDLYVSYQFSILDSNNQPIWESKKLSHNYWRTLSHGDNVSIKVRGLRSKKYLEGDQLRVRCQLWMDSNISNSKDGNIKKQSESNEAAQQNVQMEHLRTDYKKLFMDPFFHDVVLETSVKKFKTHRAILSARSSVFYAMFNNQMTEAVDGVIKINDFKDEIVYEMLRFIYCGEVENLTEETVLDLWRISDKYDIQGLQAICGRKISSVICVDNAIDILVSVDLYNLPDLKSMLMKYIINNIEAVKKTKAFENLVNVNGALLMELIHKII